VWVSPSHPDRDRLLGLASAAAPEPSGEVLATFPRKGPGGRDQELRVVLDEYQGHRYIAIRLWQRDGRGGWWPVKGKGVSIRLREAEGVAVALDRALALEAETASRGDG